MLRVVPGFDKVFKGFIRKENCIFICDKNTSPYYNKTYKYQLR